LEKCGRAPPAPLLSEFGRSLVMLLDAVAAAVLAVARRAALENATADAADDDAGDCMALPALLVLRDAVTPFACCENMAMDGVHSALAYREGKDGMAERMVEKQKQMGMTWLQSLKNQIGTRLERNVRRTSAVNFQV
jgi:hypothetical protein